MSALMAITPAKPSPIPGFTRSSARIGDIDIAYSVGGEGPPLLLLHGYPQTHAMWHAVAPRLAEGHTVVAPDLRGYGDSGKPASGLRAENYSKRAMAADQVGLMASLGHARFGVAGHDRGGRVAHRMARDHPDVVTRLAVLDIVPTRTVFATSGQELATAYFHWFFLIQDGGLPEKMIGADPGGWLDELLERWSGTGFIVSPAARAEYLRCFSDPETVRASCDDYRAAAGVDLDHDGDDLDPLAIPLLAMWGARGAMGRLYDVGSTWKELASDVQESILDCGHFLPEEAPAETANALDSFFRD